MENEIENTTDVYIFVDEYIDSFVSWDILLFFYHNPTAVESPAGLAARLGRSEDDVTDAIKVLHRKGALKSDGDGIFRYDPEPDLSKRMKRFNDSLASSSTRLSILSQMLMKGRSNP